TLDHRQTRPRRLFPHRLGHRSLLPGEKHFGAGTRLGCKQRGLLLAWNHRRGSRGDESFVRAFSVRRARRMAGYRSGPAERRSARTRHSIYLRTLWKVRRRDDRKCITYRGKSAAREIGKVLSFDAEDLNRLAGLVSAGE